MEAVQEMCQLGPQGDKKAGVQGWEEATPDPVQPIIYKLCGESAEVKGNDQRWCLPSF